MTDLHILADGLARYHVGTNYRFGNGRSLGTMGHSGDGQNGRVEGKGCGSGESRYRGDGYGVVKPGCGRGCGLYGAGYLDGDGRSTT